MYLISYRMLSCQVFKLILQSQTSNTVHEYGYYFIIIEKMSYNKVDEHEMGEIVTRIPKQISLQKLHFVTEKIGSEIIVWSKSKLIKRNTDICNGNNCILLK